MRVLLLHNYYQQAGGEDAVFAGEAALLSEWGHEVVTYQRSNSEITGNGLIGTGLRTTWSTRSYREVEELLRKVKPSVAHFHNTFPLISPAAYYACAEVGVPAVQTLHNYRLLCPTATLFRGGKVCEQCLGKGIPWTGVVHACYRGSAAASGTAAAMLAFHRALGTWKKKVTTYIALSEFARSKFIEGGLPADRILVKPNFTVDDSVLKTWPGEFALFVGRLSEEKGVLSLLAAWRLLQKSVPLKIVGDGPQMETLARIARDSSVRSTELTGRLGKKEIRILMSSARFLVFPSIWYEGFPMVIVEAFAAGLPIIASRIGSLAEIVRDRVTGLHFNPGDASDLADKVQWAWTHPEEMTLMGQRARAEYEDKYTPRANYRMLMGVYEVAIAKGVQTRIYARSIAG